MSAYYYGAQHHQPFSTASHSSSSQNHHSGHGGRSRRAPRLSSQNSSRQFRGVRSMTQLTESPPTLAFRARFEAGRSFDLDDDILFCPNLLTEDDLQSIHSSSSDGSLSSGSPHSSPTQPQLQPSHQITPSFSISSAASNNAYNPMTGYQSNNNQQMKIHQPSALRNRNPVQIINPTTGTGIKLPSPPSSISPAMMQQQTYQRQW